MRIIKVKIFDKTFDIVSKSKTNNKKQIHNIVKRSLSKHLKKENLTLNDFASKYVNLKKCRNCSNISLYDFNYSIEFKNGIIEYQSNNIKYESYKNYEKLYCGKCLKKYNANSKIYVSKIYGVSIEEANNIILERNKSPFYKNNFNTEEEYKNFQSRNENFYIKKYGKEEGIIQYRNRIKKWQIASCTAENKHKKDSMSLSFHIKKYGKEEGIKKYIKRKKNVSTDIKNFIKRYGKEKGTKKYFEWIKLLSYRNTIESYIEKYGKREGERKYKQWKVKCSNSINNFIEKYGKKEGEKKYKQWLIGITSSSKFFYSKESNIFFKKLEKVFPDLTFSFGKNEIFIYDKNGFNNQHIFYYDCYIKELNLILEYDTPVYHPNPIYLSEEEIKKSRGGNYNKDKFKEDLCKTKCYNFYRIYIKNKKDKIIELKKLINFINEHK